MADLKALATLALELTDRHDWAGREALLTPDCDFRTPAGVARGRAATTAYSQPFMTAFPDGRHLIDLITAGDDVAVVEGSWVATHTGPLSTPGGDVPATGTEITLPFVLVAQVEGELIASLHVYFDQLSFLAQLGLVPQPAAA